VWTHKGGGQDSGRRRGVQTESRARSRREGRGAIWVGPVDIRACASADGNSS
jgi:hypothetical protein